MAFWDRAMVLPTQHSAPNEGKVQGAHTHTDISLSLLFLSVPLCWIGMLDYTFCLFLLVSFYGPVACKFV